MASSVNMIVLLTFMVMVLEYQCATTKSIAYTWVSRTTDGEPCLNTCKGGTCYYNKHLDEKACTRDELAGVPIVFTVSGAECLSNCAKFDNTDYNWCYTTEKYNWDYCNPKVRSRLDYRGRTIYGDECVNNCNRLCHTRDAFHVECVRAATVPVQSCRAIFANITVSSGVRARRAPRSPLDIVFSSSSTYCTPACLLRVRDGADGETLARMNQILASTYSFPVETITVFPSGSPYTFVATRNETNSLGVQVYLPLVVRATLRRPTASQRTSDDIPAEAVANTANMYDGDTRGRDTGHIIAFVNGGTRDLFNFVSQTAATNRGPYKVLETIIKEWLNSNLGYVEMSVVISYAGTTPTEFAVKLKFFNNDDSVHSDCLDVIIKNI